MRVSRRTRGGIRELRAHGLAEDCAAEAACLGDAPCVTAGRGIARIRGTVLGREVAGADDILYAHQRARQRARIAFRQPLACGRSIVADKGTHNMLAGRNRSELALRQLHRGPSRYGSAKILHLRFCVHSFTDSPVAANCLLLGKAKWKHRWRSSPKRRQSRMTHGGLSRRPRLMVLLKRVPPTCLSFAGCFKPHLKRALLSHRYQQPESCNDPCFPGAIVLAFSATAFAAPAMDARLKTRPV